MAEASLCNQSKQTYAEAEAHIEFLSREDETTVKSYRTCVFVIDILVTYY